MEDYPTSISNDPAHTQAYAGIGKILIEKEYDLQDELPILQSLQPRSRRFRNPLFGGKVPADGQKLGKSRKHPQAGPNHESRLRRNLYYLGVSRAERGDIYGAVASFHTYLIKGSDNITVRYNRGFAVLKIGYSPWALEDFDFVLKNRPDHIKALGKKGICMARMGNPEGCLLIKEAAEKGSD